MPTITTTMRQQSCERNPSRSQGALEDRVRHGKICEQGGGKRNNSSVRGIANHHRHKKGLRNPYSVRVLKGFRDPHSVREGFQRFRQRNFSFFNTHHDPSSYGIRTGGLPHTVPHHLIPLLCPYPAPGGHDLNNPESRLPEDASILI